MNITDIVMNDLNNIIQQQRKEVLTLKRKLWLEREDSRKLIELHSRYNEYKKCNVFQRLLMALKGDI